MDGQRKPRAAELLSGMTKAVADFEGKRVEIINEDFGALAGCSAATMERYRNGRIQLRDPAVVRVLAGAAARRGGFGPGWVREFLQATRYPHPEALIAELFNDDADAAAVPRPAPAPSRWYDNLDATLVVGAPVPRREALKQLLAACHEAPVVALLGVGGTGKTALAYQFALLCRDRRAATESAVSVRLPGEIPTVRAITWVTDTNAPGSLTREQVLDAIARTLDYPGLTALDLDDKAAAVYALLEATPALVVVDNAETVVDPTLLPWLLRLPPSARVLITTRQLTEAYTHERVRVVALAGMDGPDARKLIRAQASQIGYVYGKDAAAQELLITRTGGNPQAIKHILGYAKRVGRPLGEVAGALDALTASSLFDDLFTRIWGDVLSDDARWLLVALSLFPQPAARKTLERVAGLDATALDHAITQLNDVALVDAQSNPHDPTEARLGLHPLTRAFATARQPENAAALAAATQRLVSWAADYASSFGYMLHNVGLLARLDSDEATLMAALEAGAAHSAHAETIRLARGLEFFFYIKCRWDDKLKLHAHYIRAAAALGDPAEQVSALTMHSQLLCRLNRPNEAQPFLAQLKPLEPLAAGEERFHILHARGLYHYTRGEQPQAQRAWTSIAQQAEAWGLPAHMRIGALHWLGLSLMRHGGHDLALEAFAQSLSLARHAAIGRWVARNLLQLAFLHIRTNAPGQAVGLLQESRALLAESDREQLAQLRRVQAWMYAALGQRDAALEAYHEARDLFARMGLLHELHAEDAHFQPLDLGQDLRAR